MENQEKMQRTGDRVRLPYNEIAVFEKRIPGFYRIDLAELRKKSRELTSIINEEQDSRHYWKYVISRKTYSAYVEDAYAELLRLLHDLKTPFVIKKSKQQ